MGGKTATSTSQTTIPSEVLARYNSINTMAQDAAAKPYQSFGTQASDFVAQMNQQQNAGISGVNAAAGSYKPYLDSATGATQAGMGSSVDNIQKYMSPYLTNVADTTSALMRQSNEQAQSGALGAAASSGAFGGDRAGIAAANLAGQNQLAMGKTMADIYNQGYGQAASLSQADLARQLQGGAQMAGLGAQAQGLGLQGAQAQLAAGTMQQQTEQAGKDAMIQDFMQRQGYPFQTAQFLANIALGTGVASGTTTTAERPVGFFQNLATGGRANGYADGGGVAGPMQHSQSGVGSQGYVPAGVLPVGDLLVSQIPQDEQKSGLEDVMKIASMFMGGKANGGAAVGRHGYQTDGAVREEPGLVNSLTRMARDSGQFISDMLPSNPRPQEAPIGPNRPVEPGLAGHLARAGSTAGRFMAGSRDATPAAVPGVGGGGADRMPVTSAATGLGGPGTFSPAGMPPTDRPSVTLPDVSGVVPGMEAPPAFPSPPADGLSPATSFRPAPRPAGLSGAPTAADLAAVGIGAIPVNETTAYGVGAKSVPDVRPAASSSPPLAGTNLFDTKIVPLESGGRQLDEDGRPLTSSAGAVGAAQVMEATGPEAAKLAGLPWDRDRWMYDKEYNLALGRAYFNHQLRMFGNPEKAAAAYNAGPGAVRSAIDRATALGGSYLDYLPNETQTYVANFSGGSGVSGLAGGAGDVASGLAGGSDQTQPGGLGGPRKAYEDRNFIGKFLHDPSTGKLNKDAVMSILSGLGTMASSTSMSPLTALLQGAGAGAATYSNLEQRAADIRNIDATALESTMRTAKDAIFPVDGVNMVMTRDGLKPFWEFVDNKQMSTGEKLVDDMLRRTGISAQERGVSLNSPDLMGGAGAPAENVSTAPATPSAPANVMWSDASQEAIARDREMMQSQPGQWFESVKQTSQMIPAVNAERSMAISGKPNVNEMAYVVGSAINEGNMGTAGEWYANNIIKPLQTFLPADWANYTPGSPEQSALLEKLATLSASDMTPEQQRAASVFQQVSAVYPDLNMPPDAAAAITASVMLSNQVDIDRANYYTAYLSQQPTGRGSLVNADAAFAQEYSQLHQMEKSNLTELFKMADDSTPVGQTGKTRGDFVKEFLADINSGRMSQQDAQGVLSSLLGAENTSPVLARYFIGGM